MLHCISRPPVSFCPPVRLVHPLVHNTGFRCGASQQRRQLRQALSTQWSRVQAIGFELGTETGKGRTSWVLCTQVNTQFHCTCARTTAPFCSLAAGTEKHADSLTKAAASLLLFQNVLKGRPAQAFLKVLLLLQKGRVQDMLEAYGEFYSSLAAGNHLSWQDYLLEEVSL